MTGRKVAFALGGLGGMNAHGAGFLAAAHEVARQAEHDDSVPPHILPGLEFISCSSGMIHWTAQYLRGVELRPKLKHEIEVVKQKSGLPPGPLFDPWRSLMVTTWRGLPGVFRPLVETYGLHFLSSALSMVNPSASSFPAWPPTFDELWDFLLPSRLFIPTREEQFFDDIADTFNNETRIGIAFNSFHLAEGVEYLHVNERGLELIRKRFDSKAAYHEKSDDGTRYMPIDGEYVQAGLWLFEYGFDRAFKGDHLTDGAYRRHIILDELAFADRIYVPRPVNSKWIGRLPKNIFEREDLKIETWFNASYERQSRLMKHISRRVGNGNQTNGKPPKPRLPGDEEYHPIDLVELDIQTQQGFFNYFMEHMEVFDDAYENSLKKLTEKELA